MPKRILALLLFVAALVSTSLVVTLDEGLDSAEAAEEDRFFPGPQPEDDGMGPGPRAGEPPMKARQAPMRDGPGMGMNPPMDDRMPMPGFDSRFEPRPPEYNHDATEEEIRELIPVIVDGDISMFDPGFVEDAIEFAKDNGMDAIADILSKKLADFLSMSRTVNTISSMDTRVSGLDLDEVNESDPIVLEEVEEDEDVPFISPEEPVPSIISFKPVSAPQVMKCIQLDL